MNNEQCELVFIIDRSGSMSGLEDDTIGGFNSMLKKQRNEQGEVKVTTVLFNTLIEILHDRVDINEVKDMTCEEYIVGGLTALLDVVGTTIDSTIALKKQNKSESKVLYVIITDGMENSSSEYSLSQVKEMISTQTEKYGWEFIFLGANIDAVKCASAMGIRRRNAVDYHADKIGVKEAYNCVNHAVNDFRLEKKLNHAWREDADRDFCARKKQ